jgi:hypothetical protein
VKRLLGALIVGTTGMAATAAGAGTASQMSGQYGPLTVIVSGDAVSGAFFSTRGEPDSSGIPPFSCIFLLKGTLHGDRAKIATWAPGDKGVIHGELTLGGDDATLQLETEQPGCDVEGDEMVDVPDTLSASVDDEHWIGVGMVSVDRAYLRRRPGASTRHCPYLINFDPVVILHRRPGWAEVTYLGGETPITGWVRRSDLAPGDPPGQR